MATENEVIISVSIEGADEVAQAAERSLRPWDQLGRKVSSTWEKVSASISGAVERNVSDMAHFAAGLAGLSLTGAIQGSIDYQSALFKLGLAGGRVPDDLKKKFDEISNAFAAPREEIVDLGLSLGRTTYNFDFAADSLQSLVVEADLTGRSLSGMTGIGATLYEGLGKSDKIVDALNNIRAAAVALGTAGGPGALQDQIAGLGVVLNHVDRSTTEKSNKITGLVGALGKDLSVPLAREAQQSVIGEVAGDAIGWQRFLGHGIMNERGQITDLPKTISEIRDKYKRLYGKNAKHVMQLKFGQVGGAALFNLKDSDIDTGATAYVAAAQSTAEIVKKSLYGTDIGRFLLKQNRARNASGDLGGAVLPILSEIFGWAAQSKTNTALAVTGTTLATVGAGVVAKKGTELALKGAGKGTKAVLSKVFDRGATKALPEAAEVGLDVMTEARLAEQLSGSALKRGGTSLLRGLGWLARGGAQAVTNGSAAAPVVEKAGMSALTKMGLKFLPKALGVVSDILGPVGWAYTVGSFLEDNTNPEQREANYRKRAAGYLAEHRDVPGLLASETKQIAQAGQGASSSEEFYDRIPGPLRELINRDPELQQVAQGVADLTDNRGKPVNFDLDSLSPAMRQAVIEGFAQANITIVNATGGPVEVVNESRANGEGAQ